MNNKQLTRPVQAKLLKPNLSKANKVRPRSTLKLILFVETGLIAVLLASFFFDMRVSVSKKPLLAALFNRPGNVPDATPTISETQAQTAQLEAAVLPAEGIELPIKWQEMGRSMVAAGVIDRQKFVALYEQRGGIPEDVRRLLDERDNGAVVMTPENAGYLLNLLWGFGLANKNEILERGPMSDPQYGNPGNFASTGGWTLGSGQAMEYYSKFRWVSLTVEQQELVSRVAQNIYRPCCGNATNFPDCNHGMAMLGLLELMAANGVGEEEMYRVALQVNAYWFPETYLTIAKYLTIQGKSWEQSDPRELLGYDYSSGLGYRKILEQVSPPEQSGGGSCGV